MKLFVWDFHGVLEKDNDKAVLDISNRVLEQAGYAQRFTAADNQKYYGLKWFQYFERLLPELSAEEHMKLQAACFKFAEENLDVLAKHIKPNDHALDVLAAIADHHDQIVISNTRPTDLEWFVGAVGADRHIPKHKLFGVNAHQQHAVKGDALKNYLQDKDYDALVIIGDSENDIRLREVQGGTTYLYKRPGTPLPQTVADHTITDLRQLLAEL